MENREICHIHLHYLKQNMELHQSQTEIGMIIYTFDITIRNCRQRMKNFNGRAEHALIFLDSMKGKSLGYLMV